MMESDFSQQQGTNLAKSAEREMLLSYKDNLEKIQKQLASWNLQQIGLERINDFEEVIHSILQSIDELKDEMEIDKATIDTIYINIMDAAKELNVALAFTNMLGKEPVERVGEKVFEVNRSLNNCRKYLSEAIKLLDISSAPILANTPQQQLPTKQSVELLELISEYRGEIIESKESLERDLEVFRSGKSVSPSEFNRVIFSINKLSGSIRRLYGLLDSETFLKMPENLSLRFKLRTFEDELKNVIPYFQRKEAIMSQIIQRLQRLLQNTETVFQVIDTLYRQATHK